MVATHRSLRPAARLPGPPEEWRAHVAGAELALHRAYADAARGELLALVDSLGYWEVAVREGSAADTLGTGPGTPVTFRRRN